MRHWFAFTLSLAAGCAAPANRQVADGPAVVATPQRFGRASIGDDLLARAQEWVDEGVMYSYSPNYDGYRTDCSGFVSWVWGLAAPGHTTYSLAGGPWDDGASVAISWDEIQPGDAMNFPGSPSAGTGHVTLFAGWADDAHYAFYDYEEYNFGHAASYLLHNTDTNWTGGRWGDQYIPIRLAGRQVGGCADGVSLVHGAIAQKWQALGCGAFLGQPITDELGTPDGSGRYNHFENGSIYWTPWTGAFEVHGDIRARWAAMGWEQSSLGYPVSDEHDAPGGRQNDFENGWIFWNADTRETTVGS